MTPDSSSIDDALAQTDLLHGLVRELNKDGGESIDDFIAQIKKLQGMAYDIKEEVKKRTVSIDDVMDVTNNLQEFLYGSKEMGRFALAQRTDAAQGVDARERVVSNAAV